MADPYSAFNSDPLEPPPDDEPAPQSGAGAQFRKRMEENWVDDRAASKLALGPQKLTKASPGTQYKVEFVERVWRTFYITHALQFSDNTPPNTQDVIRLTAVKSALNLSTIWVTILNVVQYLIFTYSSFK